MKVLLLSDTYSEHTEKWALGLANSGIKIGLFSFNKASYEWYQHPNITLFFEPEQKINAESTLTKLAYFKYVSILKKIIKHFKPDILHAHYATSYGLVGALCDFHPYVISSWGTDVMKFPNKNFVAKSILKYNFAKADLLCATSHTIKKYISNITKKNAVVIPFGVDTEIFKPRDDDSRIEKKTMLVASIKPLETLYNIDVLIKAFAKALEVNKDLNLLIVGEGTAERDLKQLTEKLLITNNVSFTGRIPFNEIHEYYAKIDVLANLSQYESFGVSVIEAMASGKPVIVTNVGGLAEIVENDKLGIKVDCGNVEQTCQAILKFSTEPQFYYEVSNAARKLVVDKYNWKSNLIEMINLYNSLMPTK